MTLETILQILYANKHEDVITTAIRIDNNIPLPYEVGNGVIVEVHKSSLPEGKEFAASANKNGSYGYIMLEILAINMYKIDKPYMVILPNGKTEWYGEDNFKTNVTSLSIISDAPTPEMP